MRKLKILITLTVSCFLLQGCRIVTSDRIYSVCKIENDITYCYKDDDSFYIQTADNFVPTSGVGLRALPALHVIPKDINYSFEPILPGLYHGTLHSVDGYVYRLLNEYSGNLSVSYADWNSIDFKVSCDVLNVRIIYNIRGEVRIYAIKDGQYLEDIPLLMKN